MRSDTEQAMEVAERALTEGPLNQRSVFFMSVENGLPKIMRFPSLTAAGAFLMAAGNLDRGLI